MDYLLNNGTAGTYPVCGVWEVNCYVLKINAFYLVHTTRTQALTMLCMTCVRVHVVGVEKNGILSSTKCSSATLAQ